MYLQINNDCILEKYTFHYLIGLSNECLLEGCLADIWITSFHRPPQCCGRQKIHWGGIYRSWGWFGFTLILNPHFQAKWERPLSLVRTWSATQKGRGTSFPGEVGEKELSGGLKLCLQSREALWLGGSRRCEESWSRQKSLQGESDLHVHGVASSGCVSCWGQLKAKDSGWLKVSKEVHPGQQPDRAGMGLS